MSNLLKSNGGVELTPEVCLLVSDRAVMLDPKLAVDLMLVSKSFQSLLKTYQNSILNYTTQFDVRLAFVNDNQEKIHATSRMTPGRFTVDRMTYPWLSEIRWRIKTINFLVQHKLTDMTDPEHNWPVLNIPQTELKVRLCRFKKDGLHLLYRLSDCAAGLMTMESVRRRQTNFLEVELSVSDLATLGVILEVMGQGFINITTTALNESGLLNTSGIQFSGLTDSNFYRPSAVPIQDLTSQHWIRECMCVFEDLMQRFGPCFAYAYVGGWKHKTRRPDMWARYKLQNGLDNMNAFEMGHTMSYASLQSVVWRIFCRKANCELQNSWFQAKEIVEERMSGYM